MAEDVVDTVDIADSLEISVPRRGPYVNNDRFRPSASTGSLPRSVGGGRWGLSDVGVSVSRSMSTGWTATDGREGSKGSGR